MVPIAKIRQKDLTVGAYFPASYKSNTNKLVVHKSLIYRGWIDINFV
jgi:hypothetical protein